jgi:hypothetical protein
MSKKIKIKETQFKNILKILSENLNVSSVLQNLQPNEYIKIINDDDSESIFKILSLTNDEFLATDDSGNEIIKFMKNGFNQSTKDFVFKKFNPRTNDFFDTSVKVKDINLHDINDPEENESDDTDLFKKYYDDIMGNKNLQRAFYTAPTLWNYIVAKAKGEKATGTGIYPAKQMINRVYNTTINKKFPGFTDKENLSALFVVPYRVSIRFQYDNGQDDIFVLSAGTNKAVVRPYEPGFGESKVLIRRNYGFKVIVKRPTNEKNDQFFCDIYIEKRNVKPDTYVHRNIKLTFIKSRGYEPQINTTE